MACLRWLACTGAAFLLAAQPLGASETHDFLAKNIDATVHPGDDFYQYANGGWLKRNPIPPSEVRWGVGELVRNQLYDRLRAIHERAASAKAQGGSVEQKIGDFWRTAMDVEKARKLGATPLRRELRRIDAVKNVQDALDAAFVMQTLGLDPFFALFVEQDRKDSGTMALYAWQGGLGLPERDFYFKDEKNIRQVRAAYVRFMARLLGLLGRSEKDATAAAAAVLRFETALAHASRKLEDVREPLQNYHRMAPAEFTASHTPSVDWSARLAGWNLRPEFVVVGQPEYFAAVDGLLRKTSLAVLRDYLRIRLVSAYAPHLSPAFENAHFDFYRRTLGGQKAQRPRWKRIIDTQSGFGAAPQGIGMMVARLFVAERFPETAKQRYVAMTRAMVDAYAERIRQLPWMSEPTKAKALEKLATLNAKVGYPDRWPDHSWLVVGRTSHCQNMMNIERWYFTTMLQRVGKPVDRGEWFMPPQTYNAYYNWSNNEIVLPAAIFAVPGLADEEIDDAFAYAYAGAATIGHEMTHGFDDQGRRFDAKGNMADWWTPDDAAAFEARSAVLVKQFDAYEPLPGFRINGKAALGENLADLGGLVIALDAFKKTAQYKSGTMVGGRTPLQRFFLAYAYGWMTQTRTELLRAQLLSDVHAPAKWRVLGPVSNTPEFYEAFGVTKANRMWRDVAERAAVW